MTGIFLFSMKLTILSILLWFGIANVQGQPFSVEARLTDEKKQPVELASVMLFRMPDSLLEKTAVTDSLGRMEITLRDGGNFILVADYFGYKKYKSDTIRLDSLHPSTVIEIEIEPSTETLNEVVITEVKKFIRMESGKIIVDPEQSAITAAGTAMDALKRSPGISVDQDDNITFKGKQNVMILLDDKPTYMTRDQLMNMLKNMPATQIESIELISNPPARYDASGNAGIINIKLKKNKRVGYNGNLSVGGGYGWYAKTSGSLQFNVRTQKINAFASYDFNQGAHGSHNDLFRNVLDGNGNTVFDQFFESKEQHMYNGARLGADFYLSSKTSIGFILNTQQNPSETNTYNETRISGTDYPGFDKLISNNQSKETTRRYSANLNFSHDFDSLGKKITFDLDYSTFNSLNDGQFVTSYFDGNGNEVLTPSDLTNNNHSHADIYAAKTDCYLPFKSGWIVESGFKSSYVKTDNNIYFELLQNGIYVPDSSRNNDFTYTENINAAYISANRNWKKWSWKSGLRMENTNSTGHSATLDSTVERSYVNLFPSLSVDWNLDSLNTLSLSYSRRISRPSYSDLNPFVYYADQYTFIKGNPFLKPEFTHGVSISHSFMYAVFTTLGADFSTQNMSGIIAQDTATKVSYYTNVNFDHFTNYYLSVYAGIPIKNYMFQVSFTGFYNQYDSNNEYGVINNSQFAYNLYTSHQYTFAKTWSVEISGWYNSPALYGVFKMKPMYCIDGGLKKKFPKIRMNVNVSVNDIFYLLKSSSTITNNGMDLTFSNYWESRKIMVRINWNFGKSQWKPEKRKTAADDEQNRLNGGGGSFGGGVK